MRLLLCVVLAGLARASFAAPAPVSSVRELKAGPPLKSIPETNSVSPDGALAAVDGDNAITVWSIPQGKPLFRIDRPEVAGAGAQDSFTFSAGNFSPDGRYLLARIIQQPRDEPAKTTRIVLVSIEEEKPLRTLHVTEGACHGLTSCSEAYGYFSADAKFAIVDSWRLVHGHSDPEKGDVYRMQERSIYTLDGAKRSEQVQPQIRRNKDDKGFVDEPLNRPYQEFRGVDMDGRLLGVAADQDTCALKDMTVGKRLAFLDECTEKDRPGVSIDGRFLLSQGEGVAWFKTWNLDGTLRAKIPKENPQAYSNDWVRPTADGRYALQWRSSKMNGAHELLLWDLKSGKKLAASGAPEFDSAYSSQLTPDRRHILYRSGGKIHLARLDAGAALEPEAKRFVARVEVPAAPAPAEEAAKPAPAPAPVADFDRPPASATPADPDAYAVVIGLEKYRSPGIPAVDFAARDARAMYDYLTLAMGFDPRNVLLMTDAQATKTDLEKNLGSWLKNRVEARSRVFIYYAGHGAPNPATGEGYLMPYEADPNYLEDTAYPVSKLHASLAKLPAKNVTVVLDACFSGQGVRSLLAKGARPLVNAVQAPAAPNAVVLAAAASNQISAGHPERRHGLLTAYLLEALHGAADADGDRALTTAEIYEFVRPAVERAARLQNMEQTPMLAPALGVVKASPGKPWLKLAPKR